MDMKVKSLCKIRPVPTILLIACLFLWHSAAYGQNCTGGTPSFSVNLSGQPGGTWVSPAAQRAGTCCGVSNNCVEFSILLDSAAVGINFSVASGADPGGALAYQINCGPVYYTGTPICLNGPGPHIITFCKPGNNINTYQITSIPGPQVSPPIIVNDGCTGVLSVSSLEPATVTWTSVYPGPPGAYNSYASCLSGCLSTTITGQTNPPPYVDYQVCGTVVGSCGQANYCDTVRAYFNPTLAVNIVPQNPTVCFGDAGVTITATGSGGQPPYTYTWSNGATTQSVFVGPGTYTVTMQDNSNCPPVSDTVQVTEFLLPILADAGPDQYLCRQSPQASLSGSVQAASGLQWSSSGGGTFAPSNTVLNPVYTPSPAELSAGTAMLIAQTTGNGTCPPDLDTVMIYYGSFQALLNPAIQPVSCFGLSDGSINVSISGANAPYTFSWFNGSAASGVSGLAAGTYNLTVTDRYGCDSTFSFIVTEPPLLTVSASVTSDYNGQNISCNGASDGSAAALATGGTAPYAYTWSSGPAQASATGLSAGTYTVQVTDANGCTATTTVTLTEPPLLTISASVTSNYNGQDVSCNGASDGSAGSLASGGTAPYAYTWSSGSAQASATGLSAGTYTVQVTDANGCTASTTVTLTEPPLLTISASVTSNYNGQDVSCNGASDGSAGSLVTGGTAPYAYAWSSGSAQASATGLSAGTYTVQVTDANGCTASATVTLTEPPQLAVSAFVTSDYNGQDVSCNGSSDGSAAAIATGGTAPYAYAWSSGTTQALATGLSAGTYTVQVTDANGCTVSTSVTLTEPTPLLAIPNTLNNVSCNGGSDGVVFAAPQGGVGPYTFLWNTGFAGDTLTSLPVGVYTVQVTDANNCTASANVSVLEPSALALQITNISHVHCMGGNNGSATAAASGGVAPYTYSWSNGASGSTANGLTAGTYTVTATDANGCTLSAQAQVLEPGLLMANVDSLRDVTCYGYANGYAQASASGGTSPYTFSWSSGASTTSIGNLSGGTYTVSVLDMNGCAAFASATIEEPGPLGASAGLADGISCSGAADGVIMVSAQGGTPSYTYNWSNGANTAAVSNVAPGTYTVLVSDSNGCQVSDVITVTEPAPLQLTLQPEDVSCYGYADGQIESTVTGGTPAYTYSWSNGSSTPGYSGVAGTYTLTVTDANGCVISATGSVAEPPPLNVVLDLYMEVYAGDSVYLSPQVSGGSGSYLYEWTPGETVTCSTCLSTYAWPERNTRYEILVTDANGCTAEADALIEIINTFFIPNTFTPDGDGFNEVFAASSTKVKDFEMYIFDRWGEVVFHSTDIGTGWDGFFRGSPAKQDVYVYKINVRFDNNKSEQLFGHVNLLR